MFARLQKLEVADDETFFLWGARQTGKTTLLRSRFPAARYIDLLQADTYRRYMERPELLRLELGDRPAPQRIVIDEVQKIPALLDEVHGLIESAPLSFALCGSSARPVRRGRANLLGGRATPFDLYGLTAGEIEADVDFVRLLNVGYLPRVYAPGGATARRRLRAYVGDYLRNEVAAEALVRSLPTFAKFLQQMALGDTEVVSLAAMARDCGVSAPTIRSYMEILEDTLQGRVLPAYRRRPKRRVVAAPKFFFADVGVVNVLAQRQNLAPGSELWGKAFENWVHHEICAYGHYAERDLRLFYWRLAAGAEVDFIVDDMRVGIEAKATRRVRPDHLTNLRTLAAEQPVGRRILVCEEARSWVSEDGIEVLSRPDFVARLWAGELA